MALIGGTEFNDNNTFNGIPWIFRPSLKGTGWHDQIFAKNGHDILLGLGGNDELYGQAGNDTLEGGIGNDSHYGGTGNDSMFGDLGDDSYYVDSVGDIIREDVGEGIDTVDSSIHSYTLPANVENLNLIGNARIGYGNSLNNDMKVFSNAGGTNWLYGRSGDDILTGNAGVDRLYGENNDDLLKGLHGDDYLFGGFDNDSLYGHHGSDHLDGGHHDDVLDGGGRGIDTLIGASGGDTFVVRHLDYRGSNYAIVEDFKWWEGDKVDLISPWSDYDYQDVFIAGIANEADTGIFYDNELIAVMADATGGAFIPSLDVI